jgi:dimethylargininase
VVSALRARLFVDDFLEPDFIPMPEESGAHVVVLDDQTVLMADDAPRSADLVSRLGYTAVRVDISEFKKLEGSVTCLSVRLREIPSRP